MQSELSALRSELTKLGEGLVGDIILVATHPELQLLDVALQRVDRIAAGLTGLSGQALGSTSLEQTP
jgi:hypothetical protein